MFEDFDWSKLEDYNKLKDKLNEWNIPLEKWGKGDNKTIGHLLNEIKEGECELVEKGDKLVRKVNFVGVKIIYIDSDKTKWRLVEEKQVFKDGRKRVRGSLPYGMAEKFKKGEDPKKAVIRGLKEELDISINPEQLAYFNRVNFRLDSDYPGIESYHTGYEYLVVLNDEQYRESYQEHQPDKTVYFKWKKIGE